MKNTDKVTLTIGQLKRLIKESKDEIVSHIVDFANDDIEYNTTADEVIRILKRELRRNGYGNIKVDLISLHGPAAGWPEVELTGKRNIVDAALRNLWGFDDEEMAMLYNEDERDYNDNDDIKTVKIIYVDDAVLNKKPKNIYDEFVLANRPKRSASEVRSLVQNKLDKYKFDNITIDSIDINNKDIGYPVVYLNTTLNDIDKALDKIKNFVWSGVV